MKRRLNFGCGVVHQPKVLLLDEPTVGVDPQSRVRLLDLVREEAAAGTCVMVTGLLLMSVVIALIGIINTMSLSILERRRELGLLRIIGMTDKRVRRMVTLEAVLISLLGTIGGLVLGLVVSILLVLSFNRLSDAAVSPTIPWVELVAILVLGVVLGVLAALIPARRSTRMEVLEAISAS